MLSLWLTQGNKVNFTKSLKNKLTSDLMVCVPKWLQPHSHHWAGYHGPWIENSFFSYWQNLNKAQLLSAEFDRLYIPIFWTDMYVRYGFKKKHNEIQKFIDKNLRKSKKYFTIVQHDIGIFEKMPNNVLIFSSGGVGDVPIPLLKGDVNSIVLKKEIKSSFIGSCSGASDITGVRSKMFEVLKDKKDFVFFNYGSLDNFFNITSRSIFTLCPRGYGRASFRLYEALALGSIPIYIWDDIEWLPYKDILNWDEFAISININDIKKLPEIIKGHSKKDISEKQKRIKEIYNEYFTLKGSCDQIVRILNEEYVNRN